MHACASLTAFPVFAVRRLRERKRINRLRSQSITQCYAVEVDFPLIYAAFRACLRQVKDFVALSSKWRFYRVTEVECHFEINSTKINSHLLRVDFCGVVSYNSKKQRTVYLWQRNNFSQ